MRREVVYAETKGLYWMHFIIEGRVKVCRHFGDMREIILDVVPHGRIASFQPIVNTPDEVEFAEALRNCRIITINAQLVKDLMQENPAFSSFMFQQMAERYNKVISRLSLVHPTILIRQQVVSLIMELAEEFGRKVGDETIIEHGLSQHEMACMIHRTRQSVTGVMRQLKKADLINYTRTSVLVRDIKKLKAWAQTMAGA
ncbi:MAG: Crp/Fnr family transcriptional regulator [Flavobacteriales bacterium]|nr:Crp/Fnr family transcriptional regulator [Flavobacteriales bacterium]